MTKLVDWLRRYYGSRVTGERWHQLSDQAKRALGEWIGAINYGDFANLVDRLLEALRLEKWQQNQLHRRREFWARYSNRFERIRILLPQTSVNALGRRVFTADIETLATDGSASTEVCIFDFGEWFVVEFFRGSGSETRLFRRNAQIKQVLFGSSNISVKQIRCLSGEVHDHKYFWQFYCQEWLQNKGIYPNPGLKPLTLPRLKIEKVWFPIVTTWLQAHFPSAQIIYVVIDRTNWACVNLFMISVVWDKRAFPVYFELLPKLGTSNIDEQKAIISKVLPIFNNYKICVLGDREFCESFTCILA